MENTQKSDSALNENSSDVVVNLSTQDLSIPFENDTQHSYKSSISSLDYNNKNDSLTEKYMDNNDKVANYFGFIENIKFLRKIA